MQALQAEPELTGAAVDHETVRVTLEPLTTEEASRIWALFPTANYRTSIAYLATPVWIDPPLPAAVGGAGRRRRAARRAARRGGGRREPAVRSSAAARAGLPAQRRSSPIELLDAVTLDARERGRRRSSPRVCAASRS